MAARRAVFESRKVPQVAEELLNKAGISEDMMRHIGRLTRQLKENSEKFDLQRRALGGDPRAQVPEEYDELLQREFERRCSLGDRHNTEHMSSAKWIKLLKDAGVVGRGAGRQGVMDVGGADVIFSKVLHHCEYGGNRIDFESFCKALSLVAVRAWPGIDHDSAFAEIVARICAAAPEGSESPYLPPDYMLDADVLLVMDRLNPALTNLFQTFCHWNLPNPVYQKAGIGAMRKGERTCRTHASMGDSTIGYSSQASISVQARASSEAPPEQRALSASFTAGSPPLAGDAGGDAGRRASSAHSGLRAAWTKASPRRHTALLQEAVSAALSQDASQIAQAGQEPEQFLVANGAPIIQHRRHRLSIDQLLLLCRNLGIMPEYLSRQEVVRIFKRAQNAGSRSGCGSSLHRYLTIEEFLDVSGQIAIEAYSKPPFLSQYPKAHEKVQAFWLNVGGSWLETVPATN